MIRFDTRNKKPALYDLIAVFAVYIIAVGVGAKTKWYFWPNAAVREFVGLLTAHRLKQAIIFGSMTAFYVVLTILAYR